MAKRRAGTGGIVPTPPPRGPALIRRRVAIGAIGAGAVAAALAVACGGNTSGNLPPQTSPPQDPPVLPPQGGPQPNPPVLPPQPPQPFDGGSFDAATDADASDGADGG